VDAAGAAKAARGWTASVVAPTAKVERKLRRSIKLVMVISWGKVEATE
jgi:hypothetical protein